MSAVQRMIDEMKRRGYATKTINEYSGSLRRLATYFGCCPSKLSLEQIREYQLHLARREDISWSYYNATVTALRFMYLQTLRRPASLWPIAERVGSKCRGSKIVIQNLIQNRWQTIANRVNY